MLKNISSLGKALSKLEQESIKGGFNEPLPCDDNPYSCCGAWYPGIGCVD